ncbi:MAG: Gfo/Idh/MocA family oxidoreductase [Acidobacteriota bacterium]|nr:MAG: Gfo/Idh/MocA family oxidoreductase [Acidobacteriota bacterium]
MSHKNQSLGRRDFVKSSVAATSSLLLVKPETAFGYAANSTVSIGLLGCGGRGGSVASDFVNNTDSQVTALADMFTDRLEATREHFDKLQAEKGRKKVSKLFKGPESYLEIVDSDVDMVLIASPPYFHPQHAKASIDAGKHTYLEKPVATDVRGCMEVAALAAKAEGKVNVHVGFQIRYGSHFAEQTRRIHEGALGDIACVNGFYFAGDLGRRSGEGMSAAELKLRNWVFDRALGGDIMVEQNIHIIDVYNWVLNAHPLRAEATAARKVRTDIGDVSDHWIVTYYYPNDVRASFMGTQFLPQWGSVEWRFFGPKGFSEAAYSGGLRIVGENAWVAGADAAAGDKAPEIDPLGDATPLKAQAFVDGIKNGKYDNQLKQGAESTLSAILGRQAAYEGRELSWGELLASDQHWQTDVDIANLG